MTDNILKIIDINLDDYGEICFNSSAVSPGDIFFAVPGHKSDGTEYIEDAIARGAALIIAPFGAQFDVEELSCKIITLPQGYDIRLAMAKLAEQKYLQQKPKYINAVTGTNGKTSITFFYKQLINHLGARASIIGTTGMVTDIDLAKYPVVMPESTTPDSVSLSKILAANAKDDINHICLEASSHGLDQYRADVAKFSGVAFTNLTPDHMEYHRDMDDYLQAKLRLFKDFAHDDGSSMAVINADSKYYGIVASTAERSGYKVLSYGKSSAIKPDLSYELNDADKKLTLRYNGEEVSFAPAIFGDFQYSNLCVAIGFALSDGFTFADIAQHLHKITGAPGRMQYIGECNGAQIFVDYAHTPDALQNILQEFKAISNGALGVLFGCGGERFAEKRQMMGKIAADLADYIVVTDDNPRSEDPGAIRAEIMAACRDKAVEIGGRRSAIKYIINNAKPGDTIVLAGRGHEKFQYIGSKREELCDIDEAKRCIEHASRMVQSSYKV